MKSKNKSLLVFVLVITMFASLVGCDSSELRTSAVKKDASYATNEVVETPTPKPTATATPTPEPTAVETPTPEPTVIETPTPVPTIVEAAPVQEEALAQEYILNKNTKKFHYPNCKSVGQMKEKNKINSNESRDTIIGKGYVPCKNCNP